MTDSPELPLDKPNGPGRPASDTNDSEIALTIKNAIAGYGSREREPDWKWWRDPENQNVIIAQEQLATAVYIANRDDICIRQQRPGEGTDACIFILPEHVPLLIKRLQQLIGQNR